MIGVNRWAWTLDALRGAVWPAPPLPGHVVHPLGAWPEVDSEDLAELSPTDVANLTGLTRQAASNRIARCRALSNFDNLLALPASRGAAASGRKAEGNPR